MIDEQQTITKQQQQLHNKSKRKQTNKATYDVPDEGLGFPWWWLLELLLPIITRSNPYIYKANPLPSPIYGQSTSEESGFRRV